MYGVMPCLEHFRESELEILTASLFSVRLAYYLVFFEIHPIQGKAFDKWLKTYRTKMALKAIA
jgi:hypothetical protein